MYHLHLENKIKKLNLKINQRNKKEKVASVYGIKRAAPTHLWLGFSFHNSSFELLLVGLRFCLDLLGRQVSCDMLRVQVGAGGGSRRGHSVVQTGPGLWKLRRKKKKERKNRFYLKILKPVSPSYPCFLHAGLQLMTHKWYSSPPLYYKVSEIPFVMVATDSGEDAVIRKVDVNGMGGWQSEGWKFARRARRAGGGAGS